ncbi:hypothetical protein GCM10027346_28730 [Hymenobacter seoulensis]
MPQEYLLFVDTETTGLPARWTRPYAEEKEWPHIAQLGWVVYTSEGDLVKADQAYLQIPAGSMPAAAIEIHGLTEQFLREQGQPPELVLRRLLADLATYRPRVIGHFLQLDFHVLGAAFLRAGLNNPLLTLPQFCTMTATWPPVSTTQLRRHLRLHELHELLFGEPMERLHDAYLDAAATARCFFEMQRQGFITADLLTSQEALTEPVVTSPPAAKRWLFLVALLGCVLLLLYWFLYG